MSYGTSQATIGKGAQLFAALIAIMAHNSSFPAGIFYSPGTSVNAVTYKSSVFVVNLGSGAIVVSDGLGGSATIAPGQAQLVQLSSVGNGSSPVGISLEAQFAGGAFNLLASSPSIVRTDTGAQLIPGADLTFSAGWAIEPSTTGLTVTQPALVGEVTKITQASRKQAIVTVTNHQSPAEEKLGSTPDEGNWQIEANRLAGSSDAGQVALEAAYESGALTWFSTLLPLGPGQTVVGDRYIFSGVVEEFDAEGLETKKQITMKGSIAVSGPLTAIAGY
jgi:hypothetical protein